MFDEKFEDGLSDHQKGVLARFRNDLKTRPIRPLNKEERDTFASSVFRAQQRMPTFRDALAVLSPYMDATCSTAYTDKYARVGLSYWFFELADPDTRAFVVLHEAMHVLNYHFGRADTLKIKPRMMNYAGDLEINTGLATVSSFKNIIDESFLLPNKYDLPDYKTMEVYVSLLQEKIDQIRKDAGDPDDGASEIDNASDKGDGQSDTSDGGTDSSSSEGDSGGSGDGSSDSGSDEGQQGDSGNASDSGSGEGQAGNGSGDGSGSGEGSSGGTGQSGNGPQQSGFGEAYDDLARKMKNGDQSKGGGGKGSLQDLVDEDAGKQGKCSGKHAKPGDGGADAPVCDGSCGSDDNAQPGDGDSDSDSDNGSDGGPSQDSSIENYKRSIGSNGGQQKVGKKPIRHCDDSTIKRSEAADSAGISKTSDVEQNIARNNTKARVVEELNKGGRGAGSNNEFLKIALGMMSPPKVDWRDLFRRAVATSYSASIAGRSHQSYKRVNKRYSQGSVIFPGTIDHSPTVMFGIDTSGSMGGEDFRSLLAEIESIIKSAARQKNSLRVFSIDTTIKNIEPVSSVKNLKLSGGGGTDMSVAFAYVNSLHKSQVPSIFVLGTDGGTDWNSVEDQIRVGTHKYHPIILVTQKYSMGHIPASLYEVASIIDISED